jgi:polysaccharide biosynthesis/export protein
MNFFKLSKIAAVFLLLVPVAAQAQNAAAGGNASAAGGNVSVAADYLIGPGDELQIFVWKNPDLSVTLPVRPDGRISTPLVADMQAQGKTPTDLAANLRTALGKYVQDGRRARQRCFNPGHRRRGDTEIRAISGRPDRA